MWSAAEGTRFNHRPAVSRSWWMIQLPNISVQGRHSIGCKTSTWTKFDTTQWLFLVLPLPNPRFSLRQVCRSATQLGSRSFWTVDGSNWRRAIIDHWEEAIYENEQKWDKIEKKTPKCRINITLEVRRTIHVRPAYRENFAPNIRTRMNTTSISPSTYDSM